jgi:hypothetical protein
MELDMVANLGAHQDFKFGWRMQDGPRMRRWTVPANGRHGWRLLDWDGKSWFALHQTGLVQAAIISLDIKFDPADKTTHFKEPGLDPMAGRQTPPTLFPQLPLFSVVIYQPSEPPEEPRIVNAQTVYSTNVDNPDIITLIPGRQILVNVNDVDADANYLDNVGNFDLWLKPFRVAPDRVCF